MFDSLPPTKKALRSFVKDPLADSVDSEQHLTNRRTNPNCVVCPEDGIQAVSLEGVAEKIADAETIRRFIEAYNPKYQWDLKPETVLDMGPIFAVRPRKVIAVDATPGEFAGQCDAMAIRTGNLIKLWRSSRAVRCGRWPALSHAVGMPQARQRAMPAHLISPRRQIA